jgi:hypothetical protein
MMAGDIARKYIDLLDDLEDDEDYMKLNRIRHMPFPNSEELYNEAVKDFIQAKLDGTWN